MQRCSCAHRVCKACHVAFISLGPGCCSLEAKENDTMPGNCQEDLSFQTEMGDLEIYCENECRWVGN